MRAAWLAFLYILSKPVVTIGGSLLIAAALVGGAYWSVSVAPSGVYEAAQVGAITGMGGTTSDLSFETGGKISSVSVSLGQSVAAGQALMALDHAALDASLASAQATLESAQAHLASLEAGTRPEQVALDQTTVAQDQVALRNAVSAASIAADTAVHVSADQFFDNPRTTAATFSLTVPDAVLVNQINSERIALEPVVSSLISAAAASSFATDDPSAAASQASAALGEVNAFLADVGRAISEIQPSASLSATALATDATTIGAARTTVAASISSLTTAMTALKGAQGALTIAQAGATTADLASAQAAVDAAAASAQAIRVSISQSVLTAPVAGTIARLDAQPGETVTAGEPIVSITAAGGTKANALLVPASAVIAESGASYVFVQGSHGPIKTRVETGLESASQVEIVSGIKAGDEVLVFTH